MSPDACADPHPEPWPVYDEDTIERCRRLLLAGKSFDYKYGVELATLEQSFAAYHGREFALTTNSGTSALFLAYLALGLAPGDEVVVPTWTFLATATPLFLVKAAPVLADSGDERGNVTAGSIERALTPQTKGVVVTHLFGSPCDMGPIADLTRSRGLFLVEDCSHAHGAHSDGRRVGTWGDVAVFSVGGRKLVSGGLGGVLLTDSAAIFDMACLASAFQDRSELTITNADLRALADVGFGGNLRMSPLAATLAASHFLRLDSLIAEKAAIVDTLIDRLALLPGLEPVPQRTGDDPGARYGVHLRYSPTRLGLTRSELIAELRALGARVGPPRTEPLHRASIFTGDGRAAQITQWTSGRRFDYRPERFPLSERISDSWIALPADYLYGEAEPLVSFYVSVFKTVWDRYAS